MKRICLLLAALLLGFYCLVAQGAVDALGVLNAQRAQRGLYPYVHDEGLFQGAARCADARASMLRFGHLSNDFAYLPEGVTSPVAGCAAWPDGMGFGACEEYGTSYRYCGAAWTRGADNRMYCHAFYSNRPNGPLREIARAGASAVKGAAQAATGLVAPRQPHYPQPIHRHRGARRWR